MEKYSNLREFQLQTHTTTIFASKNTGDDSNKDDDVDAIFETLYDQFLPCLGQN